MRLRLGFAAIGVVVALPMIVERHRSTEAQSETRSTTGTTAAPVARFVGEAACAPCHAREAAVWKGSHHQLAMQPASAATVLGNFANARFDHGGVSSRFFRQDGKLMARTDGPDGALHDYEITHAFGVAPLQQYLVALGGGRVQALEIAWDSRPPSAGGQRWFHLYPDEKIGPDDPLHWTGVTESWNFMCADCHSTNVRKGWNAETRTYSTSFAEVSVACEACHGPGSQHVAWASQSPEGRRADDQKGLAIALDERDGVSWDRDAVTNKPARSRPRTSERELEMCARCHSRRGLIHEDSVHGQPAGDDYRIALLDEELYYPDGQIKGEVYEYGSFIQSRMFAAGVTCSDCHDPHRPELRATGDNLCLKCHAEAAYFTPKHHFHAEGSAGARCVGCHMPAMTYMVVDPRRDHSLRVPRPDLSVKLGVPNACNGCHDKRSSAWAARTVEKWYGHTPSGLQQFGETLASGASGAPGAQELLAALVADRGQPAIARASGIARMQHPLGPATLMAVRGALGDPSSLVRRAAVHALEDADPRLRASLVAPLVEDAVRAVRIEAAMAIAGVPPELVATTSRDAVERATAELVAAQELDGERPEAHLNLALLHGKRQDLPRAEAELRYALSIDPRFVPALVNLADLFRATGRDDAAEATLRDALTRTPNDAALLHALGLVLVRQRRLDEAVESLGAAARLGADNPRYGYVYAVALHDAGRRQEALRELEGVLRRRPYDRESLAALVAFYREAKDDGRALAYAKRLAALGPITRRGSSDRP